MQKYDVVVIGVGRSARKTVEEISEYIEAVFL